MHVLMLLRDLGLDPASDQARRALGLVRDGVTWKGCGPQECERQAQDICRRTGDDKGKMLTAGEFPGRDMQITRTIEFGKTRESTSDDSGAGRRDHC